MVIAEKIRHAAVQVCRGIGPRYKNSGRWESLTERKLATELASCLLGSRVRFESAYGAANCLDQRGLLSLKWLRMPDADHEAAMEQALGDKTDVNFKSCGTYPFRHQRSRQLRACLKSIENEFGSIVEMLSGAVSDFSLRKTMAETLVGFGPKQASLFLRNIGFSENLAVLDTHVLKYMTHQGMMEEGSGMPRTLKEYEYAELAFSEHAGQHGFSVAEFDLAVWVVVRVAGQEKMI